MALLLLPLIPPWEQREWSSTKPWLPIHLVFRMEMRIASDRPSSIVPIAFHRKLHVMPTSYRVDTAQFHWWLQLIRTMIPVTVPGRCCNYLLWQSQLPPTRLRVLPKQKIGNSACSRVTEWFLMALKLKIFSGKLFIVRDDLHCVHIKMTAPNITTPDFWTRSVFGIESTHIPSQGRCWGNQWRGQPYLLGYSGTYWAAWNPLTVQLRSVACVSALCLWLNRML